MNRKKFHVKKGETVAVIAGNHKGSIGKVLEILRKNERVLIEGVHMIKKHIRKSQDNPSGGIIEREGSIHISNVKKIEETQDTKKAKTSIKKKEVSKAS